MGVGGFGKLCVPLEKSWLRPWPDPGVDLAFFQSFVSWLEGMRSQMVTVTICVLFPDFIFQFKTVKRISYGFCAILTGITTAIQTYNNNTTTSLLVSLQLFSLWPK